MFDVEKGKKFVINADKTLVESIEDLINQVGNYNLEDIMEQSSFTNVVNLISVRNYVEEQVNLLSNQKIYLSADVY
jgi:hypothetical protein